jgi:hypothetical protein
MSATADRSSRLWMSVSRGSPGAAVAAFAPPAGTITHRDAGNDGDPDRRHCEGRRSAIQRSPVRDRVACRREDDLDSRAGSASVPPAGMTTLPLAARPSCRSEHVDRVAVPAARRGSGRHGSRRGQDHVAGTAADTRFRAAAITIDRRSAAGTPAMTRGSRPTPARRREGAPPIAPVSRVAASVARANDRWPPAHGCPLRRPRRHGHGRRRVGSPRDPLPEGSRLRPTAADGGADGRPRAVSPPQRCSDARTAPSAPVRA